MSEIADFLRARYAERRALAEAASPGPWRANAERDEVVAVDGITVAEGFALSGRQLRATVDHIAANDPADVIADLDAKLALIDELEPPEEPSGVEEAAHWCCNGVAFHCPLCPQPRIGRCPGHPGHAASRELVRVNDLHARRAHPAYEYATTEGPRKQWDDADVPPRDDNGEPESGWEPNTYAGCDDGWERFDYTEESYWRRLRPDGPRAAYIPRGLKILAWPFAGRPDHKGEEWAP